VAAGQRLAGDVHSVRGQVGRHDYGQQPGRDAAEAPVIPPGQLGHGLTAVLRRQPLRPGKGRPDSGGTGLFELICGDCGDCGDYPYLDYGEVPAPLQRLRGPRTMRAALAAYDRHLGLAT
jgi:hypothetical protein